MLDIIL